MKIKENEAFPFNKRMLCGLDSWCIECRKEARLIRTADPIEKARSKELRLAKIDADPLKHKNKVLQQKFGITLADYMLMLEKQNGVCAICKRGERVKDSRRGKLKDLAIDHCHKTGKLRGILCDRCNTSIGKFEDDPNLLQSAIAYLLTYSTL